MSGAITGKNTQTVPPPPPTQDGKPVPEKPKSDTPAQDCATGNCDKEKDCECYCNKPIDETVFASVASGTLFLGKTRAEFIALLNSYFDKNKMTECIVKAHFLSQCSHESGGFSVTEERYSKMRTVKDEDGNAVKDEKGKDVTEKFWRDRYDKADIGGQFYHGRGYIQLTGFGNYDSYFGHTATDAEVESVATDLTHALGSSFWYWTKSWNKDIFSPLARDNNCTALTKKLNGGSMGLSERKTLLQSAGSALKIRCCSTYKEVWSDGKGIR